MYKELYEFVESKVNEQNVDLHKALDVLGAPIIDYDFLPDLKTKGLYGAGPIENPNDFMEAAVVPNAEGYWQVDDTWYYLQLWITTTLEAEEELKDRIDASLMTGGASELELIKEEGLFKAWYEIDLDELYEPEGMKNV